MPPGLGQAPGARVARLERPRPRLAEVTVMACKTSLLPQSLLPDPGEALRHITKVGYRDRGQSIELTQSFCRSDVYGFIPEMRREP